MRTKTPSLVTAYDVGVRLGFSKARVYQMCRRGVLPHIRFGKTIRFDTEIIERFIDQGGTTTVSSQPQKQ